MNPPIFPPKEVIEKTKRNKKWFGRKLCKDLSQLILRVYKKGNHINSNKELIQS